MHPPPLCSQARERETQQQASGGQRAEQAEPPQQTEERGLQGGAAPATTQAATQLQKASSPFRFSVPIPEVILITLLTGLLARLSGIICQTAQLSS